MTWEDDAKAIVQRVQTRLMTASEFDAALADLVNRRGSPVSAVQVEVQGPGPMPSVKVGRPGGGEASDVETWLSDDQGLFQVRTELWWGDGGNDAREIARGALHAAVAAWWRGDGRNEKSRLPSGQSAATQRALEETLRSWLAEGPVVFCAADIDNFGHYNNHLGLQAGDDLIARLGGLLLERAPRDCLVVHRSGDEFCLLFPATTAPGAAAALVMVLREEVEAELQDGVNLDAMPGLAIGVATCTKPMGYGELEDLAGKALKPDGEKRRGRVTVLRPESVSLVPGVKPIDLQLLLALNLLGEPEPFNDPFLDAASVVAERQSAEALDLQNLAERLQGQLARFAEADDVAPAPDVVIAAAHGIARAALAGGGPDELVSVSVRLGGDVAAVLAGDAKVLVAGEQPGGGARTVVVRGAVPHLVAVNSKRAVLITIGDSELSLPSELFGAVIFVDDRPTKGGGLPDLWEAAIAQLVVCVTHHANVDRVFLAGTLDLGKQTVARLHDAAAWTAPKQAEALAGRIGAQSMSRIMETGDRIAGRVVEVSSAAEIVNRMMEDLEVGAPVRPPSDTEPAPEPPRLRRTLSMDDMLPDKEYGCRVATASEAFPVALDIVRHVKGGPLEDQTGRGFRELVDFRIQLSQPRTDPVPRFYLSDQVLLDGSFERGFVDANGLFRSVLNANGQLQAVVNHVAQVVATGRFTSRRALLVVPHVPADGGDLSPLGLVSIRVIPRPVSPRTVRLDYSFSWRTVEALVGLPYSLYGSIRFAEHLTALIAAGLTATQPTVAMGTLSYIAHSLHMFVDEYADQVARQIVNDDSL